MSDLNEVFCWFVNTSGATQHLSSETRETTRALSVDADRSRFPLLFLKLSIDTKQRRFANLVA